MELFSPSKTTQFASPSFLNIRDSFLFNGFSQNWLKLDKQHCWSRCKFRYSCFSSCCNVRTSKISLCYRKSKACSILVSQNTSFNRIHFDMDKRRMVSDVEDTLIEEITTKLSIADKKEQEENNLCNSSIEISIACFRKKLIVLDVNGLLADIVSSPLKHVKPDAIIAKKKALFKRPYYLEFLNFCFERFEVAVWSSRSKKSVDKVIDCLMGDMKQKLVFCWDLSHCSETSFKTLENKHKLLVFKDLRKIWDKYDPNLPWEKGYYNESNTLLLDDSPYKALFNPPNNSIFPHTFSYKNLNDNSLAAGGDLRRYLDGLANAENMLKYVEENPFGQERITETDESWGFYLNVINSVSFCQSKK